MSSYITDLTQVETVTLDGDPLVTYNLLVHVRGAVELMAYTGGTPHGKFLTGGAPAAGYNNTVVKLEVSDPAATYYLNRSASVPTNFSVGLDYWSPEIPVKGEATLTLTLSRGDHTLFNEDQGGGTVKTTLDSFTGEFVQLDFATTIENDVLEQRAGAGACRGWVFTGYEDNVLGAKAEK